MLGCSMMQNCWQESWLFRHFGDSYKWLLYGDDDTFFFLDAAMNVLQHLDPEMPYFLTGGAAVPGQYQCRCAVASLTHLDGCSS